MKKLLAVLIMVTYMASAIGFTYSLHYCGGHFKGVCFTSDTEKGCCGKGKHKENCCKNKVVSAKFKGGHAPSAKALLSKVFFVQAILVHAELPVNNNVYAGFPAYVSSDPSPPFSSSVAIYLLDCVLRYNQYQ
jgi:hypothetical protein